MICKTDYKTFIKLKRTDATEDIFNNIQIDEMMYINSNYYLILVKYFYHWIYYNIILNISIILESLSAFLSDNDSKKR